MVLNFKPGKYLYNMKSLVFQSVTQVACEQALWGALAVGWEKEGELATTSLNLNSASNSPVAPHRLSYQISAKQREVEMSANVNKH